MLCKVVFRVISLALSPWPPVYFVKVAVKVVVKVDNWHTVAVLHGFGRGSDNTLESGYFKVQSVTILWCLRRGVCVV